MLSFIQDYAINPVKNAASYVVEPLLAWGRGQIVAATTKGASSALTKKVVSPLLDADNAAGAAFNDQNIQQAQNFSEKAKSFVKGMATENVTDAGLKVVSLMAPLPKPITYLAPRAAKLVATASPAKVVVIGALSHGFGRAVQDSIDAYLPQAAPYGGYVGYGVASQVAQVGLEKLDRIRPF
ncbi:MAG: hypothetical protein AB7I18_14360 [Candidatus Berkiella sp.]